MPTPNKTFVEMIPAMNGLPAVMVRVVHASDPMGIYGIFNTVNGKVLVGSSVHLKTRWKQHRNDAQKGVHTNPHFQAAWNKYGMDAFEFRVLEIIGNQNMVAREDYWINYHHSLDGRFGYNLQNASQTIITDACRANHSKSQKGIRKTPAWRKKIGEAQKWRTMDAAHREHLRVLNTGKKQSEASSIKKSLATKGRPKPAGFGAKISKALTGRQMTAEQIEKMKGPKSETHKQNLRIAAQKREAKKREEIT